MLFSVAHHEMLEMIVQRFSMQRDYISEHVDDKVSCVYIFVCKCKVSIVYQPFLRG